MGIMDVISSIAKNSKTNKCPYCNKPLKLAEENMPDGLMEEEMWQTVYTTFFIPVRRGRMICTNPKCKHNFRKTHHKFVKNLLGDRYVLEHWWQDAIDPPAKSKKKGDDQNQTQVQRKADGKVNAEGKGEAQEESARGEGQAEGRGQGHYGSGGENAMSSRSASGVGGENGGTYGEGGGLGGRYVGQNPLAGTSATAGAEGAAAGAEAAGAEGAAAGASGAAAGPVGIAASVAASRLANRGDDDGDDEEE